MLKILHYVFILCTAAFSVSGFADMLNEIFSVAVGFAGLAFSALVCASVLLRSFKTPSENIGTHWFMWSAALALLSRSVFPEDVSEIGLAPHYAALLFLSILLPALLKNGLAWIVVYLFTLLFYLAQTVTGTELLSNPSEFNITVYTPALQFAGAAFLGGLIPWLILRKRGAAREKEFDAALEKVYAAAVADAAEMRAEAESKAASAKKSDQLSTVALNANTMVIENGASSTDTFTLLNVGGEEVNAQLKSMLYFMRYNFKALTACAFICNPAKNVVTLNCHESKLVEGMQVLDKAEIPFGSPGIGQVACDPKFAVLMTGDMSIYRSREASYYAVGGDKVNSLIAAPIIYENKEGHKELLGVLSVDSVNKNAFTEHDKEQMRRFSLIAGALITNIRMSVKLDFDSKMFRTYYEASHGFSVALKMGEILDVLMNVVPQFIPACGRLVFVAFDSDKNCLRVQRIAGAPGELREGLECPLSGGLYSFAFIKNQTVSFPDFQAERGKYYRFVPNEPPTPARTFFIMPVMGGEDRRCIGLFSIESGVPNLLNKDVSQLLKTVMENATVAITRSLLYFKMEKLATTDGLTGLNNHRTFQEILARELERARRYQRPLSLLLTDIDHFKSFNDTYGHPVGDLVLREISGCIRQTVRANDFPARYGGEEFAVILPETDEQGAHIIAERIRAAVEARVVDSGTDKLRVTISIGCVTFPTFGTTQQEIIDCSDRALYASKKGGRNRVTMYAPGMTVAK